MIKEITLPLGALEVPELAAGQVLATGWYVDQATGLYYYYDAISGQWYYYAAGYIYPMAISWKPSPSPKLTLAVGDKLRIRLYFKYQGPAITNKTFHAAIGEEPGAIPPPLGTDFAEIKCQVWSFNIPRCDTVTEITDNYIEIVIPSAAAGECISAYVKWEQMFVKEGESTTPLYYNVADVLPAAGEFSEFKISKFEKG